MHGLEEGTIHYPCVQPALLPSNTFCQLGNRKHHGHMLVTVEGSSHMQHHAAKLTWAGEDYTAASKNAASPKPGPKPCSELNFWSCTNASSAAERLPDGQTLARWTIKEPTVAESSLVSSSIP